MISIALVYLILAGPCWSAQHARTAEEAAALKEKWDKKWEEQQTRGFTSGTLDEYFAETKPGLVTVVQRTPRRAVFTSAKYPGWYYSVFQVESVQGRSLLLGPVRMPNIKKTGAEFLRYWRFEEPSVRFDEAKNYSGQYQDEFNWAPMFVIYERRGGAGKDVAVQALYAPARVTKPYLASQEESTRRKLEGFFKTVVPGAASQFPGHFVEQFTGGKPSGK